MQSFDGDRYDAPLNIRPTPRVGPSSVISEGGCHRSHEDDPRSSPLTITCFPARIDIRHVSIDDGYDEFFLITVIFNIVLQSSGILKPNHAM